MADPAHTLHEAAERIRTVNHTSRGHDAYRAPSQVYDTYGALAILLERLPQTISQAADALLDAARELRAAHNLAAEMGRHAPRPDEKGEPRGLHPRELSAEEHQQLPAALDERGRMLPHPDENDHLRLAVANVTGRHGQTP